MKVITVVAVLGLVTAGSANYEPTCPENNSEEQITLLPNLEDCTSYFMCLRGNTILKVCSEGQHFNAKKQKCTDPEDANCKVTPSYPVECPVPNGSGDIILLPNPKDCTTYFRCREGIPIIDDCEKGMHFDPHRLYCTYPEEAGCNATATTSSTLPSPTSTTPKPMPSNSTTQNPTTVTAKPVTCPPNNEPIKLPNPDDCSSYYQCNGGDPTLTECPQGLHFNPIELECDFPEDAGCEDFSTPSTTTNTTTSKPTTTTLNPTTTTSKSTSTTSKPTTTTSKPTTTTSKPTTTTSKPTTTTSKPTTTTSKPTTTTSKPTATTSKPTTTSSKPTSSTSGPIEIPVECPPKTSPNEQIFIPHPKDCGSYYLCSNGYPWLMHCPPGLYFNIETKQCDYPMNTTCVNF